MSGGFEGGHTELTTFAQLDEACGRAALSLYARLDRGRNVYDESIDLSGAVLDVGAGDGRYGPAIRELGAHTVYVAEPKESEVRSGVRQGFIDPTKAYVCRIEDWAELGHDPVDVAYALNVARYQIGNPAYIGGLAVSVREGGLLVTSFTERPHADRFLTVVAAYPQFGLRLLMPSPDKVAAIPPPASRMQYRDRYLCLWRQERATNSGVAQDAEADTMGALAGGDKHDAGRGVSHLRIGRVGVTYWRRGHGQDVRPE